MGPIKKSCIKKVSDGLARSSSGIFTSWFPPFLTIRYTHPKLWYFGQYQEWQDTASRTYCRHPTVEKDMFEGRLAVRLEGNRIGGKRDNSKDQQERIDPKGRMSFALDFIFVLAVTILCYIAVATGRHFDGAVIRRRSSLSSSHVIHGGFNAANDTKNTGKTARQR